MNASETCRCGARIDIEYSSIIPSEFYRFQDKHDACRGAFARSLGDDPLLEAQAEAEHFKAIAEANIRDAQQWRDYVSTQKECVTGKAGS